MQVQTNHHMDPKRIRLDMSQAARSLISPQNGNGPLVTPDTLFVNVNNQAFPILGSNSANNATTAAMQSVNTATTRQQFVPTTSTLRLKNLSNLVEATTDQRLLNNNNSNNNLNNANNTNCRQAINNLALKNQLLNLPISKSALTTVARNVSNASNAAVPRSVQQAPPPPPFSNNVARMPTNLVPPLGFTGIGQSQSVSIPALQIRIGSKKFKPVSNVTFKDDGILFTLKDYTYAPVLLNARAIVKCKANLNTYSYPALFLFLESSCMRQIRNIFSLTHKEFSFTSPVELKQCITIFPIFGVDGKSQSQQVMYSIKRSFDAMIKRYPRSCPILEEITNDQVIDILLMNSLDKPDNPDPSAATTTTTSTNNSTANSGNSNSGGGGGNNNSNNNNVTNNNGNNNNNNNVNNANSIDLSHMPNAAGGVNLINEYHDLTNRTQRLTNQQPILSVNQTGMPNSATLLVIPNDQAEWQNMQKNLMVGGLYHALMPTGQRKYCLWNGTQLVPCLVQNTEVQLTCNQLKFGLDLIPCVGQVRIRSDQSCGIFFTARGRDNKLVEVSISTTDIIQSQLASSQKSAIIILSLIPSTADKLSELLKIGTDDLGRLYDSNSNAINRKYLFIFLSEVNKDQEEAMMNMKFNMATAHVKKQSHMFTKIDANLALRTLIEIGCNCSNDDAKSIIEKYSLKNPEALERLIRLISTKESIIDHSLLSTSDTNVLDDDDDDDIIMTSEELGVKCPYTQKVMEEPVKNTKCGHNYEKKAILDFINNKKGNAKCPYAGCGNREPLKIEDLEDNVSLKEYITNLNKNANKT